MLTRGGRVKYQDSQHLPGPTKIPLERGADPVGNSIEEHEAAIRSELAKWRGAPKAAGVKPRQTGR